LSLSVRGAAGLVNDLCVLLRRWCMSSDGPHTGDTSHAITVTNIAKH
jgi:hypothetical protein